jgi:hypothetical protein
MAQQAIHKYYLRLFAVLKSVFVRLFGWGCFFFVVWLEQHVKAKTNRRKYMYTKRIMI